MSKEATAEFCGRVEEVLDYCRQEWDLTYAEAIGCLELIKANLIEESSEDEK